MFVNSKVFLVVDKANTSMIIVLKYSFVMSIVIHRLVLLISKNVGKGSNECLFRVSALP
jgi:hypothetical protein